MGQRMSKRYQSLTGHLEIEGTKKAFDKDKVFILRKSNSYENKTNEENNVSNTEGNGNDKNKEKNRYT